MTRGSVAYTAADNTQSIFGLGINETDVLDNSSVATAMADSITTAIAADESSVTSLASALSSRLVTVVQAVEPAVRTSLVGANINPDTVLGVVGLETDDVLVSATIIRGEVTTPLVSTSQTLAVAMQVEDVLASASITEDQEVTFEDMTFEPDSILILTYMDLTPDTDD